VRLTFENFLFLGIRYRLSRRLDFWVGQKLKKKKFLFFFTPVVAAQLEGNFRTIHHSYRF
jgi:hypothetical protein